MHLANAPADSIPTSLFSKPTNVGVGHHYIVYTNTNVPFLNVKLRNSKDTQVYSFLFSFSQPPPPQRTTLHSPKVTKLQSTGVLDYQICSMPGINMETVSCKNYPKKKNTKHLSKVLFSQASTSTHILST